MKQPYEMSREEWYEEREKCAIDGMPRYNANGAGRSETVSRLDRLSFLCYGVGKWLYDKACEGEEWALESLEYSYDTYEMVIRKAKEEGKIINNE